MARYQFECDEQTFEVITDALADELEAWKNDDPDAEGSPEIVRKLEAVKFVRID